MRELLLFGVVDSDCIHYGLYTSISGYSPVPNNRRGLFNRPGRQSELVIIQYGLNVQRGSRCQD